MSDDPLQGTLLPFSFLPSIFSSSFTLSKVCSLIFKRAFATGIPGRCRLFVIGDLRKPLKLRHRDNKRIYSQSILVSKASLQGHNRKFFVSENLSKIPHPYSRNLVHSNNI